MHGKKQACEKNTSSMWLYKHHTRKILLIFPSLPFLTLPYLHLVGGVPLLVNFFRYFTALLFPCETYLTVQVPYCTVPS